MAAEADQAASRRKYILEFHSSYCFYVIFYISATSCEPYLDSMGQAQRFEIEQRPVGELKPYARNARRHSKTQVKQIADSISRFGFTNPVLISDSGEIIAGHGRVEAAKQLGLRTVPTLKLSHLSEAERRAYVLADNKVALNAGWDQDMLAIELQALIDLDFDVTVTGFSLAEVDLTLDAARDKGRDQGPDAADEIPAPADQAVSRRGDLWLLGRHRLLCGDARDGADYERLMDGDLADLIFTDPPYNVAIDGNVTGLGRVRHREFAMAAGEMSEAAFVAFLTETLGHQASWARDGAIAFVCMDWRHMKEMLAAGQEAFTELKNLCVWNKTNGGMGTFYRSKHELVFVFKVGTKPHVNTRPAEICHRARLRPPRFRITSDSRVSARQSVLLLFLTGRGLCAMVSGR